MADEIRDMPRRYTDEVTRVINDVCEQNDITQADVAQATGLHSSHICRMFDGQYDPNYKILAYLYEKTRDSHLSRVMFGAEEVIHLPLYNMSPTEATTSYLHTISGINRAVEVVAPILSGGSDCKDLTLRINEAVERLMMLMFDVRRQAELNAASNKIDKVA